MPSRPCSLRVDEELFKKLEAEAKKQGKSRNQLTIELIEKGFKYINDAYRFETVKKLFVDAVWDFVDQHHERER